MKRLCALAAAAAMTMTMTMFGAPALAGDPSEEEIAKIFSVLAEMQCEMDEDEIDKEDDGFELDDVFCADGQYDMEMNTAFEVVEKRKE